MNVDEHMDMMKMIVRLQGCAPADVDGHDLSMFSMYVLRGVWRGIDRMREA